MSKRTVVSDYIENKLNSIKRDSFLEEIHTSKESLYSKQKTIIEEINNIYEYIKIIKENKDCYIVVNGKKVVAPNIRIYISNLRKIILKYREYCRYLKLLEKYQTRADRIINRIQFESSNVVLSDQQYEILKKLNNITIDKIMFIDLIDIAKYLVRNYEGDNLKLELILKELGNRLNDYNYTDDEFIMLSSLKCVVSNTISNLDKDDFRRAKLNEFKKYIKSIIELLKITKEEQFDYRFDIVIHLLENEYCFNRLLENMPDIVNLKDKEGYSLAHNIISRYLDAFFLEIKGKQHSNTKDNYLKLYNKVTTHPYFIKTMEEQTEINNLIENFKEMIKNSRIRRDKYLDIVAALDKINNFDTVELYKHEISSEDMEREKIFTLLKQDKSKRKNLIDEDTVVMCGNNEKFHCYAYSVTKNSGGNHILKVHITDVREFIKHNSELDLYLKSRMFKDGDDWLDESLLNKFSLNLDEIKPVFTFEIEVMSSGKISDFKCYKSHIKVNNIYTFDQVNREIKDHSLRFLPFLEINYFINKNIDRNNYALNMNNTFNEIVFNNIGSYFHKNNLPYVYKIQKEQDSVSYMQNMAKLNSLFSKISKEHFYKFYHIICDDVNYSRYTKKPERHSSLGQEYYTDLFIPLYSYIGLFLQEILQEFYLEHPDAEILNIKRKVWNKEIEQIIETANQIKEYKRDTKHKEKIKTLKGSKK